MKHKINKITAIIITKNEEKMITSCLKSVDWVDQILVVDTGSSDKTRELAKKEGSTVIEYTDGKNFSDYRNYAISKAKSPWVLFVDADERVTLDLKKEILKVIFSDDSKSGYAIARLNNLLGHDMKWGGWWPDYVMRLIKVDRFVKYTGELHEQPQIKGKTGKLKSYFYHITHRSLTSMIEKTNKWSEYEARLMFDANHPKMNIMRFFTGVFREFWYRAILKLGFLDGPIGIIEIVFQMFSRFVSYSKLWELQIENNKNESSNS